MKVDVITGNKTAEVKLLNDDNEVIETFNVREEMHFGVNVDTDLIEHPAKQFYYEQLLADQKRAFALFDKIEVAKFLAHCRLYAKYVLKGLGEKDTLEGRQDVIVSAFSRDLTEKGKGEWVRLAYRGYLTLRYGVKGADEKSKMIDYEVEIEQFKVEMYAYQQGEGGIWYEELMEILINEEYRLNSLKAIAEGFKARGFMLGSYVDSVKERVYNVDGMSVIGQDKATEEVNGKLARLHNQKEQSLLDGMKGERSKKCVES